MSRHGRIPSAVDIVLNNRRNASAAAFKEKIKYRYTSDSKKKLRHLLRMLVRAYTRSVDDEKIALDALALEQMVWQIKRKFFELEVRDHLCVFLTGPQGCGKSTALKKFFSCLPSYYVTYAELDQMNDRGVKIAMMESPVTVIEEARMDRSKIETLKAFITEQHRVMRDLYAAKSRQQINKTTLVGSSNIPLEEIISDPTGARRFWSITSEEGYKMDYNVINSVDTFEVFQLVDENEEESVIAREKELGEKFVLAQRKHVRKSGVEVMIDELFKFHSLPQMEQDEAAAKPGFLSKFFDLCATGVVEQMKNPEKWTDDWTPNQLLLWDAYSGQSGSRHIGFHKYINSWDRKRDKSTFKREVMSILKERFGQKPALRLVSTDVQQTEEF